MKKILAFLFSVMMIFALVGCGGGDNKAENTGAGHKEKWFFNYCWGF